MVVKGGTFTSEKAAAVASYAPDGATATTGFISGGTFSSPVAEEYCAEGYIPADNDDGTYGVKEGTYVAKVGDTRYLTIQEALDAVDENGTITLLADGQIIMVQQSVTILKNGHVATVAALKGYTVEETETAYVVIKTSEIVNNAGEVNAYIDLNNNGKCDSGEAMQTLQAALDAADPGQTVRMTGDITAGTVIIPTDITLDLQSNTLTLDRLIGLNGSYLMGDVAAAKLIVAKDNVLLADGCVKNGSGYGILPIWLDDHYEFSLFNVQVQTSAQGLYIDEANQKIQFKFAHQNSGAYLNELTDGGLDNGIKVIIEISWTTENGAPYQTFVYNDTFFGIVAAGGYNYTFNLNGYSAMDLDLSTMKIVAKVVTDTGAAMASEEYTIANDKLN